jgi:predicted DNA binding CopG/RHH family protein
MEEDLVARLKALAAIKGIGYQTLLRQFVADRVYEEEKREGVLK